MTNLVLRPNPKFQIQIWIWIICVFLFFIFPFVFLGFAPGLGWLYVVLFLLGNALWLVPAFVVVPFYYRTIVYELGEREIVVRRGLIVRSEDVVPYGMITNVAIKRGPIQRLLGLGSLHIHTAGYSQQTGAEAKLAGIDNWEDVHAEILRRIRQWQQGGAEKAPEGSAVSGVSGERVVPLLEQILQELRALRESLISH